MSSSIPRKKTPQNGFISDFYQTVKEETISIFQKTKNIFTNFYDASISSIPKSDKDISRKGNYRPNFLMNIDENIFNISKFDSAICKKR